MSKQLTSQIDIDASPSQVWDVLCDFAAYEDWNPFIVQADGTAQAGCPLTLRLQPAEGRAVTVRPTVLDHRSAVGSGGSAAWGSPASWTPTTCSPSSSVRTAGPGYGRTRSSAASWSRSSPGHWIAGRCRRSGP
jgi:hypothetical protein